MRKSLKKIVALITALSIIVVSLVSAFATDDNKTELMFVDGSSCEHIQYTWAINVPSSCTTDGEENKICITCQTVIDTRVIPASGHDDGVWTVSLQATCLNDGEEELACTACGEVFETKAIPATGHDEGIWKIDFEPTIEHDGQMSRCHDCGAIQKEVIEGDLCCPLLIIFGGTTIGITIATIIAAWNAAITAASIVGGVSAVFIFFKFIFPELQKIHTVTYKVNGEIYRFFLAKEGGPVPVPKDPEVAGQEFNGWEPEVPEVMPDHDLVFEADMEEETVETVIPETGSAMSGTAAITVTAGLALAVLALLRKKKES